MERLICRCLAPTPPGDPSPRLLLSWATQRADPSAASPITSLRERRPSPLLASLGIHIPAQRRAPASATKQSAAAAAVAAAVAAHAPVVSVVEKAPQEEEKEAAAATAATTAATALEPDALSALFAPSSSNSSKRQQPSPQRPPPPPPALRLSYSSLFQYRACPLSYYYAHVLALPTRSALRS